MQAVNLLPAYARPGHRWVGVGSELSAARVVRLGSVLAVVLAAVFAFDDDPQPPLPEPACTTSARHVHTPHSALIASPCSGACRGKLTGANTPRNRGRPTRAQPCRTEIRVLRSTPPFTVCSSAVPTPRT